MKALGLILLTLATGCARAPSPRLVASSIPPGSRLSAIGGSVELISARDRNEKSSPILRGTISSKLGPVSGAIVLLQPCDSTTEGDPAELITYSGPKGDFELAPSDLRAYRLVFFASSHTALRVKKCIRFEVGSVISLEVRMKVSTHPPEPLGSLSTSGSGRLKWRPKVEL